MSNSDTASIVGDLRQTLGAAVVDCWGLLPQEVQQQIFEAAVAAGAAEVGENALREELALFLHENHPRTDHPDASSAGNGKLGNPS